ncbi:MAG: ATPase, T2SS/T4P/T4SS family [Candidatus Gracilibacteria bacterium]|nr:ATPase, T2SS/T4P/T4SS family [Candidatus Gracilibacteria bacterium]
MSDNKKTEKNIEEDIDEDKKEELAEKILEKEENSYHSKTFLKIENEVKDSLKNQKTDDALRDITLGALFLGSSDVHYECYENEIIVRLRIDGILVDIFELSKIEYKYVLERLKYASHLKLNITNIPQDGKYEIKLEHKKIDVKSFYIAY